jgi:hypothetical protein
MAELLQLPGDCLQQRLLGVSVDVCPRDQLQHLDGFREVIGHPEVHTHTGLALGWDLAAWGALPFLEQAPEFEKLTFRGDRVCVHG